MSRPIYERQKDRDREDFVRAVLHHKYGLEKTSSLCPYDFIGGQGIYDTIFELKARTYKMGDVPDGLLYLTFEKYQKIVQTLVPYKKLLIMNPEGLWIGDFEDIEGSYRDYVWNEKEREIDGVGLIYPRLIMGGRYDRNDSGDVQLHVLFPVNKLTNIYTREELLKLQNEYNTTKQIFTTEEIQRLLNVADQCGDTEA